MNTVAKYPCVSDYIWPFLDLLYSCRLHRSKHASRAFSSIDQIVFWLLDLAPMGKKNVRYNNVMNLHVLDLIKTNVPEWIHLGVFCGVYSSGWLSIKKIRVVYWLIDKKSIHVYPEYENTSKRRGPWTTFNFWQFILGNAIFFAHPCPGWYYCFA